MIEENVIAESDLEKQAVVEQSSASEAVREQAEESTLSSIVSPEPYAIVAGQPLFQLPDDLYIPPDALEVFLETFTGPLDLLLYLIKRHNLDILNIPIAKISQQYISYIELMQDLKLELAAEYLLMAAMLAEIKSRMLLPKPTSEVEEDEDDPRAELVRRLQEYERFKQAAEDLDQLLRYDRDIFPISCELPECDVAMPLPKVQLEELLLAFREVLRRAAVNTHHRIQKEVLSVHERMATILTRLRLNDNEFIVFQQLFDTAEGRLGVVVSFMAILELTKQATIEIFQKQPLEPIYVRAVTQQENDYE